MPGAPLRELVLEIRSAETDGPVSADDAVRALLRLPGVTEAHVDEHHTWAMVTFDPGTTAIATITGCLAAHGLPPSRARPLVTDSDPCE